MSTVASDYPLWYLMAAPFVAVIFGLSLAWLVETARLALAVALRRIFRL